jgi:hypothetical protein
MSLKKTNEEVYELYRQDHSNLDISDEWKHRSFKWWVHDSASAQFSDHQEWETTLFHAGRGSRRVRDLDSCGPTRRIVRSARGSRAGTRALGCSRFPYGPRRTNRHSRLTWRVRNSPGCCPAFLSAAKAPGVATIWPSSNVGCLLSCCIWKNSFRWFRVLLLRGTAESRALKANALPGGARRLAVRAVKAAWFSRSSERSG